MIEPLPAGLVDALSWPAAHPHDPDAARGVEHLQTHISHVFLTATRVYKLRKAVDLGFLCFATRAERNADCLREVTLNRRLAPDVYLGVAKLEVSAAGFRIGALCERAVREELDPDAEHCVVMRRLPTGRDALSLLEHGALSASQVERVATLVAGFHARVGLGRPAPFSREEWLERIRRPVEANFEALGEDVAALPRGLADETHAAVRGFLEREASRFEARRLAGRGVDAHGDLHLQHVFFEQNDADPILIDCLEFSDELRQIDEASEVAFLAMDLRYRGRKELAEDFLRAYARESDDFDLYRVVDFFLSYRAAVRAKVAAIAAGEAEIDAAQRDRAAESAARHLELAREALAPRRAGALVLVCGAVGTGKSTAAAEIADAIGGAVIASDRVRKRLAGLSPTERPRGAEQDVLYTEATTDRVYAGLFERADPVSSSGRAAVLDATWSRRRHREDALSFASERGLRVLLVRTHCARDVALRRLAARAALGRDPSDAGPERFDPSMAAFEIASEWPAAAQIEVATERDLWREELRARVEQWWAQTKQAR